MMRSRIRASFSPFFSSIMRGRDAPSLKSSVSFLNSFQFNVEGLRQTIHNSALEADDDDAISELGPQSKPRKRRILKLMTEKTDHVKKYSHRTKIKYAPVVITSLEDCTKGKGRDVSSNNLSAGDNSETKKNRTPRFSQLKMLQKQLKASTGGPNELESFESADSRKTKIDHAADMKVESSDMAIHSHPAHETITIRISDICTKALDSAVHATCGSCGSLLGIARTGENSVDAVFSLKDKADSQEILKRLNSIIKDGCHWRADVESGVVFSAAQKSSDECVNLGSEIGSKVSDLREEITWRKLCCEDFLELHRSIMHLEGQHVDFPKSDRRLFMQGGVAHISY